MNMPSPIFMTFRHKKILNIPTVVTAKVTQPLREVTPPDRKIKTVVLRRVKSKRYKPIPTVARCKLINTRTSAGNTTSTLTY